MKMKGLSLATIIGLPDHILHSTQFIYIHTYAYCGYPIDS